MALIPNRRVSLDKAMDKLEAESRRRCRAASRDCRLNVRCLSHAFSLVECCIRLLSQAVRLVNEYHSRRENLTAMSGGVGLFMPEVTR